MYDIHVPSISRRTSLGASAVPLKPVTLMGPTEWHFIILGHVSTAMNQASILSNRISTSRDTCTCSMSKWNSLLVCLLTVLRFAQEFFTEMQTTPMPMKGCKFRPMLGTQGLWAGRDLHHATLTVTRNLCFSGLNWRTAPFSRLLWHAWWGRGQILSRIPTGLNEIVEIANSHQSDIQTWE
jgi:hypothetical protein